MHLNNREAAAGKATPRFGPLGSVSGAYGGSDQITFFLNLIYEAQIVI